MVVLVCEVARVRVTPGTRFIDYIRITYSPSRMRSRRHTKKVELIALCYKALCASPVKKMRVATLKIYYLLAWKSTYSKETLISSNLK